LTDRLRWRVQTLAYASGSVALLLVAAAIVFGVPGAMWLVVASAIFLAFQDRIPVHAIMRLRGARPVRSYEAPTVHAMASELARRAGLVQTPALYYVPRRQPEAFTVASGDHAAIAVSSGLLDVLDPDELFGVLAHEVSHVRAGDTRLLGLVQSVRQLTGTVVLFGVLSLMFSLLGLFPAVSPFVPLLLVVPGLSAAVAMAVSRTREFDADLGAAALLGDPRPLARALWKLERFNLGLVGLLGIRLESLVPRSLHTHPPTAERVDRLLALVRTHSEPHFGGPPPRPLVLL